MVALFAFLILPYFYFLLLSFFLSFSLSPSVSSSLPPFYAVRAAAAILVNAFETIGFIGFGLSIDFHRRE